jgi:hypothetical protein
MSSKFDPATIKTAMVSSRWSGLARLDMAVADLATWDPRLVRHSRVLVPVDVQALYVPAGDTTKFVRLPCALTTPDGQPPEKMPEPLSEGVTREPGVYLHWAPPDALLRGTLTQVPDASRNRLGMPPLPDRWVVLRIIAPTKNTAPVITGWVLEADTAKMIPLEKWPAASATTPGTGQTVASDELTGTVGGAINWTGTYDASVNRFAFHDPQTDIPTLAPSGVVDDLATYLVAGWWSDPKLDPLDVAETSHSLSARLAELNWSLMADAEGGDQVNSTRDVTDARRATLGLASQGRYGAVADAQVPSAANLKIVEAATATKNYTPLISRFSEGATNVIATEPRWPRSTLLHGLVHGVPVKGPVITDQRPQAANVEVALGRHGDDVAGALAAAGLGLTSADDRRAMERLLAAFTGQLLAEFGTQDGVVDSEEHEHNAGFASKPGGPGTLERLRKGAETGPLNVGRAARSEAARVRAASTLNKVTTTVKFTAGKRADLYKGTVTEARAALSQFEGTPPITEPTIEVREVRRPAPRFHFPLDPLLAIRSGKRSLRYIVGGRFSHDSKLACLWPSQISTIAQGVIDGRDYVSSLGNGSLPDEVLLLARNAVVRDPYLVPWLAQIEAKRRQFDLKLTTQRLSAESAIRYGANAVYDGTTAAFQPTATAAPQPVSVIGKAQIADQLRRFSVFAGVDMSPVAITSWSQPWAPLWLEWEVEIGSTTRLDGWRLSQVDLDTISGPPPANATQIFRGRSPLHTGTARTLAASIEAWLKAEEQRDKNNTGEVDDATEQALQKVVDGIGYLDILTGSLDGLSLQLLGIPVDPFGVLTTRVGDTLKPPAPINVPQLLVAGILRLKRARMVDAFGRTLDLPVDKLHVVARDEQPGAPPALILRPRLQRPARWLFRLVDPSLPDIASGASDTGGPAEANVDQIDPAKMINPVAGFLLPDHIDESLEVFDTPGNPLGQLMHEPFGGGVTWEIAPGRSGPADAGPGFGLDQEQRILGLMSAGMVASDAQVRGGRPAGPDDESALSAFLRAIDTTLWTIDTFAQLGNEHIAGLVGRPVTVVRATLRLDIDDDLDELDLSDPAQRAKREAAYRDLADRAFPVRLGELTRSDDGLLGFFVDDDYAHFHVVDKVVRDSAFDSRPGRGQFNQMGLTKQVPDIKPIKHPYIVAEDELLVHPGQIVTLTLLMHPAGRVHLTSGVLPRKYLQLARDWVQPGLAVMAPSARIGPVLIDPDKVRLPKISSFPKDQIWTRRSNPSTWKDDPILAATQTALFPDMPSQVEEGYIRIAPNPTPESGS